MSLGGNGAKQLVDAQHVVHSQVGAAAAASGTRAKHCLPASFREDYFSAKFHSKLEDNRNLIYNHIFDHSPRAHFSVIQFLLPLCSINLFPKFLLHFH